ncbi:MAG: glycoside hydrolase family 2 [Prevotella sp.]|nr:glycoside hydrolase family 2 [Prevotella sp.]
MRHWMTTMLLTLICAGITAQSDLETRRIYLSGTGCDDMVQWDFYCTGGQNAGKWAKIGVPSCWETQGFGTYQYGIKFYGKEHPEGIADEQGRYKYEFTLPQEWNGRQLLLTFEGVMTDATVTINGRKAGDAHQGAFYRFSYDVTDMVNLGKKKNVLEVEVSKESTNARVNLAERRADYWNFGGIFRPVFFVSKPSNNIRRVAIDAGMDGRFKAEVFLNRALAGANVDVDIVDAKGKSIGKTVGRAQTASTDHLTVDFSVKSPKLWTAETPNLYTAVFTLKDAKGAARHVERQKFGFRTIEYRDFDGVYINGKKVIFKGVCRHSFRPESGRTLSKRANIEDVNDIKGMNMNAVRLSHYPADPEFLEACDSLGLYVMNELSGWHFAHETLLGQKLVEEFVTRDVNHPSVIFWSSGNEGGFNFDLEPTFKRFDVQQRVVLYPWLNRNGFETGHYRTYGGTQDIMRQKEIYMPTEFLHGLYDGGHGAGLYDYWKIMMANPRCAGGFLWDFSDQGVVRTDLGGVIDCNGNYGADGILGPHHEREGSFYAIREIWSPVELVLRADGRHIVRNHYNFLNLSECSFSYQVLEMPPLGKSDVRVVRQGTIASPDVAPGGEGTLPLVVKDGETGVVKITATDPHGNEIFAWSYQPRRKEAAHAAGELSFSKSETDDELTVKAGSRTFVFSKKDGLLKGVQVAGRKISLANGPRFVAGRRADRSLDQYYNHGDRDARKKENKYVPFADKGIFKGLRVEERDGIPTLTATYQYGIVNEVSWSFLQDGRVKVLWNYEFGGVVDYMGMAFDYPEPLVRHKQWVGKGPYRVWRNRMQGPQLGFWQNDYNDPIPGESFEYPEFKGYFGDVQWMLLTTDEGKIGMEPIGDPAFVGVYTPRDGRDQFLYDFPETGLSLLDVIPGVPNKNHVVDLNGPSAQPYWSLGVHTGGVMLTFE